MKKFLALCGCLIMTLGACLSEPPSVVSAKFLQPIYTQYNNAYFDGSLPQDTIILYAPDPEDETNVGSTQCGADVLTGKPVNCKIYIAPYANKAQPVAVETLIHEMCHVAMWQIGSANAEQSHGKAWQNCMLNIAKEGGFKGVW